MSTALPCCQTSQNDALRTYKHRMCRHSTRGAASRTTSHATASHTHPPTTNKRSQRWSSSATARAASGSCGARTLRRNC